MRDLHNSTKFVRGISPVVGAGDNVPQVSQIIDTQGFEAVEFVILTGTIADADATFTVLVEDGNAANLSDAAAVDDKFLLGTEAQASFTFAADDAIRKIGYKPAKRYVRLTITPANNTGTWPIAVTCQLGGARHKNPVQGADGALITQVP